VIVLDDTGVRQRRAGCVGRILASFGTFHLPATLDVKFYPTAG
jgi:hypothetical protein